MTEHLRDPELPDAILGFLPTGDVPVVRPRGAVRLAVFVAAQRAFVEEQLLQHAAVLFRGYGIESAEAFREVVDATRADPLKYVYRSTPRTEVSSGIYTATEYPARATIPQHSENAYAREWPMKLFFCCVQPALEGGETPLARTTEITAAIPTEIRRRFEAQQVMYVRNYGGVVDLPWETVFQTNDRQEVERFCQAREISYEWKEDGLRTRQVCQGMARHPRTGDLVWFNQAHLFHPTALEEPARRTLAAYFKPEDYPRNAFYGDGTEFEPETLAKIRAAFDAATFTFSWERGDVLLVDNMLVTHGRRPFKGPRRVLVAMTEAHGSTEP